MLSLAGAACGSGDDGGSTTGDTIDADVKSEVESAITASTATADVPEEPASMQEWEELWASERQAVVDEIRENGWGTSADGATLTGPDGFTVDLSACTAGWSPTEGLTDDEIEVGVIAAMSGNQADLAGMARGYESLFKAWNEKGGFPDSTGATRTVRVITRDDAYDPARTIPLLDELIDAEKVFAVKTVGTPATLNTYGELNERCIPHFASSGHPGLGDPVNHPWTPSTSISYTTEAVLWGTFIEQRLEEFGGTAKVSALVTNNDFGTAYDRAFEAYLAQSPHRDSIEYSSERVEASAATVKDQMTTIAAGQPDVFLGMLVGNACLQVVTEAAQNGMKEETPYKFLSSACKASAPITRDVVGDAPDGWWTMGGGLKEIASSDFDGDPWIEYARDTLASAGHDHTAWASVNLGLMYSWGLAQAMLIAGELDGGLTRPNLILALRTIDMTNPQLLPGVQYNMRGNSDGYLVEGSDISQWDAEAQAWVQQGPAIDISGKTEPCPWDPAAGRCSS